jgi:hypothetical protein
MYAKIAITNNIAKTLHYHENKIQQRKAECLYAGNFVKDVDQLTWEDKLFHFQRLNGRKEAVEMNTVHISVNFHRLDELSNSRMQTAVKEYMEEMGLGNQPFLVYRHYDATHPHAHLVCTNVQNDGEKITLERSDFFHSKTVTAELEEKYGLQRSGHKLPVEEWQEQNPVQRVHYGETPLFTSISRVLDTVVPNYSYTSLDELNAVLSLYNIRADRGQENSRTYQHDGLIYRPLDENGKAESAYIKASVFKNNSTLKDIRDNFDGNQSLRESHRLHMTATIDWSFVGAELSLEGFRQELAKEHISVVLQRDKKDDLQHIWYIDHEAKTVFEGADLGVPYTRSAITQRCISEAAWNQRYVMQQEEMHERHQNHFHHF